MRILAIFMIVIVLLGCKKKEALKPPESVQLVFPENNSECTTGIDVNETTSQVQFSWQTSNNTETYELVVTNLNNGNKQNFIGLTSLSKTVPILKGTPYSWVVKSMNSAVLEVASSPVWNFYNSGYETAYTPFPAEIIFPKMGSTVLIDINNEVELEWTGVDLDNDIVGYDVYFSTENPPENLILSPGASASATKVTVTTDTVYYWRIITKDNSGNSSDTGVFEFRAI